MLNESEAEKFVELISNLEWPVPKNVFDAICENLIVCPVELAVVRNDTELLLLRREKDKYFDGTTWHMPGSIILPGRTAETTLQKLIEREVGTLTGVPELIGAYDVLKGAGFGMGARGQEVSRFFLIRIENNDSIQLNEDKKFFPLESLADDMLITNHQLYVRDLRSYLKKVSS